MEIEEVIEKLEDKILEGKDDLNKLKSRIEFN